MKQYSSLVSHKLHVIFYYKVILICKQETVVVVKISQL
jgi:hypothetical protein